MSCLEVTGKDNIEKTEKCIKEKLYKDFVQYETHCNCIDDETGIARKNVYGGASSFNVVINTINAMRRL